MVEHKPLPKMKRFARKHWLHAIQVVAWLALTYYYTSILRESGWIPAFESDPLVWWVKGMAICGMAAATVYGTKTMIVDIVVKAWRES